MIIFDCTEINAQDCCGDSLSAWHGVEQIVYDLTKNLSSTYQDDCNILRENGLNIKLKDDEGNLLEPDLVFEDRIWEFRSGAFLPVIIFDDEEQSLFFVLKYK